MDFSYTGYGRLLSLLCQHAYEIVDYHDYEGHPRCVILRHDIDTDLAQASVLRSWKRREASEAPTLSCCGQTSITRHPGKACNSSTASSHWAMRSGCILMKRPIRTEHRKRPSSAS